MLEEEVDAVGECADLIACLFAGFAHLVGELVGESVGVFDDLIAKAGEDRDTFGEGACGPCGLCGFGAFKVCADGFGGIGGDLADDSFGGGVDDLEHGTLFFLIRFGLFSMGWIEAVGW